MKAAKKPTGQIVPSAHLRRRAEWLLDRTPREILELPAGDVQKLVHELQVHQIELEMQNDELRRVQLELESSRDRFGGLYDSAPVAYVTLDPHGRVLQANLTAARLLGLNREQLLSQKLTAFIIPDSQDAFYLHRQLVFTSGVKQTCEMTMRRKDGAAFFAEAVTVIDRDRRGHDRQCLMAFTDRTALKRAELELRDAHEFSRQVIADAKEGIIVYGRDLQCQVWNHFMEQLSGVPAKDVIGRPPLEVFPFLRAAGVMRRLGQVMAGKERVTAEFQFPSAKKGGSFRWVSDTSSPLRNARGEIIGIISVVRDFTERRQAEEQIAQLNRAQAILAGVDHAIVHLTDKSKLLQEICRVAVDRGGFKLAWIGMVTANGTIQPVAKAGETGYLRGLRTVVRDVTEISGLAGTAIRENRPVVIEDMERDPRTALWRDRARQYGLRYVAAFPIRMGGKAIGSFQFYAPCAGYFSVKELGLLAQVSDDITFALAAMEVLAARQRAELALRQSEQELTDFFEESPLGLLWLGPKGNILRVNQAKLEILDQRKEDVLGQFVPKFHVDPEAAVELLRRLGRGETVRNYRMRVRQKDGSIKHVLIDANGLWENNRLIRCRWYVRDITRRVELEREILAVAEEEQQRLGRDLHDDLCQQLAGIEFLSDSLAKDLAGHAKTKTLQAREIAKLARKAMNQTRELARGLSPVPLEMDGLMDALRELAARTQRVFRRDCYFKCQVPVLVADHAVGIHIYRIAQEAVGNAVKHGKARRIDIALKANGNDVLLGVSDDGIGIPLKPRLKKGMGLRIMQYRAGVIGGSLIVERKPDGGTQVVCTIKNGLLPPGGGGGNVVI